MTVSDEEAVAAKDLLDNAIRSYYSVLEPEARLEELGGVPEPLCTDTDEWLAIGRRLSDSDLAALQKVLGIAADVMS